MNARLPAFGALLVSLVLAQDKAASAKVEITLPISDQVRPVDVRGAIVVEIVRDGDAFGVRFAGRTSGVAGEELDPALAKAIGKAGEAAPAAAFVVRADARAPYRIPYLAVKAAAEAGLTRFVFVARKDAAADTEGALSWQLPGADAPVDPEGLPDIRLTARMRRSEVFRTFEADDRPIAPGAVGDRALEGALRAKRADLKHWKAEIPVVVEAEAEVPWQHVIDLVGIALRTGSARLELDIAARKDDPRAARLEERRAPDVEPSPGEVTSRPTADITPPRSSHAVRFEAKDPIEVWLASDSAAPSATRHETWRWQVRQRAYRFDRAGWRGLTVNLAQLAGVVGRGVSSRTLLIRTDARAPFGLLQKTLEAAALARLYKIHIAAIRDSNVPIEAVKCWLPADSGGPEPGSEGREIRLLMSWNSANGKLERILEQTVCPVTPEGDATLEATLRARLAAIGDRVRTPPFIIDAGPRVACQAIVDALDFAAKLGLERVEFGFGAESW